MASSFRSHPGSTGSESVTKQSKPPPPVYTFRGHSAGVTALASLGETLISGDEVGAIHLWNLANFRQRNKWTDISASKIQSLKVIKLPIKSVHIDLLVCQTRDNGVKLIRCDDLNATVSSSLIVVEFPTYEALFSRGDALTTDDGHAILAYPSNVASHMVAVRYLGPDGQTLLSGNASRQRTGANQSARQSTVFDIQLVQVASQHNSQLLVCGYEDGFIVIYKVDPSLTTTVPELNVTGLKIEPSQEIDFGFRDFIGAFDVKPVPDGVAIVCGSVRSFVIFCNLKADFSQQSMTKVPILSFGTSAITIRNDLKMVALADWGSRIKLYSMKSRLPLAFLDNHQGRVEAIIFVKHSDEARVRMCCGSLDNTISIHELY